jgi:hypothetical protein
MRRAGRGGRSALWRAAILAGLLAIAACRAALPNAVVDRAEDAVRRALPNGHASVSDGHPCGDADAAMGDVTFLNEGGAWEKMPFVYSKGEVALQRDTEAFVRLSAVCTAALQAQTNELNTNRAAINAVLAKRGVNPDGPPPP